MVERRATINEVAKAAGVSRGTVSRVINDSPRVSPEARLAVQEAIRTVAYRVNPHARSLASGRNDAIAVLLTRPNAQLFEDPTFSLILQGISDAMVGTDLSLVLLLAGNQDEQRRTAQFIDPHHVDGVIHLSPLIDDPMVEVIASSNVPVVVCGRPTFTIGPQRLWAVTTTDVAGAQEATNHLRGAGAQRIAMIAGPKLAPGSEERLQGFRHALGAGFDPELVFHGDYGRQSGALGMAALIDQHPDIDAVFCASDRMAVGALETLRLRGIEVPGDVLVAGFDDHEIARQSTPSLTTVHQPIRRLGRAAVETLVQVLAGHDPDDRVFQTSLVVRDSTTRVNQSTR